MSNHISHIPTPWPRKMQQLRHQFLPVLVFVLCGLISFWMLSEQKMARTTLIGEVSVTQVIITSPISGILNESPDELFAEVTAGQIIGRLSDRAARAALATLQAELAKLKTESDSIASTYQQALRDRKQSRIVEARRLSVVIESLRIDVLDREAGIATDKIRLNHVVQEYEALAKLMNDGFASRIRFLEVRAERDELVKSVSENEKAIDELNTQLASARNVMEEYSSDEALGMDTVLGPIRAEIVVQEARIAQLHTEIDGLLIRSPINGKIATIIARSGQAVGAGDELVSINGTTSDSIVIYVPERRLLSVYKGMSVEVYPRSDPSTVIVTHVSGIGPGVELVPEHQLRLKDVPEWGRSVRIAIPSDVSLCPGELVDVRTIEEAGEDAS